MDNTIEAGITSQEKATLSVLMMEQLFLKAFLEIVRFSNSKVVRFTTDYLGNEKILKM